MDLLSHPVGSQLLFDAWVLLQNYLNTQDRQIFSPSLDEFKFVLLDHLSVYFVFAVRADLHTINIHDEITATISSFFEWASNIFSILCDKPWTPVIDKIHREMEAAYQEWSSKHKLPSQDTGIRVRCP